MTNKTRILKISLTASNILALGVFFSPELYPLFGKIGWYILCFMLVIRPINDLLPKRNLSFLVASRRELGILCASFILAHTIGYFLFFDINILDILNARGLSLSGYVSWGLIGVLFMIPPLITSNNLSMKFLKRNWKRVQRLTYGFFLAGAVHVAIVKPEERFEILAFTVILSVLLVLAYHKNHAEKK